MADRRVILLEEGWTEMKNGVEKLKRILEGEAEEQFNAEHYMRLYTTIYDMCTQKPPNDYSEVLYERYKLSFKEYIEEKVLPSLQALQKEQLLRQLKRRWENHKIMVRWLSRFFNYLDRYYVLRHNLEKLEEVGLIQFRDRVYLHLNKRTKDAVLDLIEKERDGESIDRSLIKSILEIFIEVGMKKMDKYENDFEHHLLTATAQYYRRQASAWVEEDSTPQFMQKAENHLKQEDERVDHYLHHSTRSKMLKKVENELVKEHQDKLLNKEHSGCAALLRDDKKDDLARMFRLFSRVEKGLEPVADVFKRHVSDEGMKLVKEVTAAADQKKEKTSDGKPTIAREGGSHEQQYVRSVIELHDKYTEYVETCFNNSSLFHKALKEAFESFFNKNVGQTTSAELMANFCDNLLKKGGSEKLVEDQIEETLDKVVKLLAYISDKDIFAEFYRKKLARRLLWDKSASDDHERNILSRLKQQCGAAFTSKMEGMVTDLQLAREKQREFDDWRQNKQKNLQLELNVTVLTTGFWPSYKAADLRLAEEMVQGVECFKEFYEENIKHRKLNWIYSLGMCHLKGNFKAKPVELVLATFQAALLLLFNQEGELTVKEIEERLNLPTEDVQRGIASLCQAKYKILTKSPEGRKIEGTDLITVNEKFTSQLRRIKIPLPPAEEKKKVLEDVDKDRGYTIDAAIVRIMKSRKVMTHQKLQVEVSQQLQRMFKPDMKLIKKRIEGLIQREYIEREADNQNTYKYLA